MRYLVLVIVFCSTIWSCAGQDQFDVRKYGATGDGITDDKEAFQKVFDAAAKSQSAEIVIPYGTYKISDVVQLNNVKGNISIRGVKKGQSLPVVKAEGYTSIVSIAGTFSDPLKGRVKISNLHLKGKNAPYSAQHPMINKYECVFGLVVKDINEVIIKDIQIDDVYGEGIWVSTSKQNTTKGQSRISQLEISNCKINNVWGFNPEHDNYGDGIFVGQVSKGIIQNNIIRNDIAKTKQLGRSGIVIEFYCENISVLNNRVEEGYDRIIHIEATTGGHLVKNNYFAGSNLGILIFEGIEAPFKPMIIENNEITNKNFRKDISTIRPVYASGVPWGRSLLYAITNAKTRTEKQIHVRNNRFFVDGRYRIDSDAFVNNKAKGLTLKGNSFEMQNLSKKMSIRNFVNADWGTNKLGKNVELSVSE